MKKNNQINLQKVNLGRWNITFLKMEKDSSRNAQEILKLAMKIVR